MSRIYFHSPSGTTELRGSERAHMGMLCADLAAGVFGAGHSFAKDQLCRITDFDPKEYEGYGSALRFQRDFEIMLFVSSGKEFRANGETFDVFSVCLNTALAVGNDAVRLCARLHGQCEIHTWVSGENRAWLAGIVERGRKQGIFRPEQGWEAVVSFLRERADEPVVTSYSVCSQFPNAYAADWTDERDGDGFWDLPAAERWDRAFAGISDADSGLEMTPERWSFPEYYFSHGETALSLLEKAYEMEKAAHPERFGGVALAVSSSSL